MRNSEERFGGTKKIQDATPPSVQTSSPELNFITPTEFVELPSSGKFYPEGHPLHGKQFVEIKQMTAKEEDILTSKNLLKKGLALDRLIASVLIDKKLDPDSLTVEDRNAIIVASRIYGYGEEYETNVVCPECETKVKTTFNLLEKLPKEPSEEAEEDVEIDERGCFTFTLPSTKWKVVCRALSGKDEKTITRISETKRNATNDSILLDQLYLSVISVEGISEPEVVKQAINAMPAMDSKYIRKKYAQVVKPLDMTHRFTCSKCNHEADMEVPLSVDFFWFK